MDSHFDYEEESYASCGTGTVYDMLVSWILQDPSEKPGEFFKGIELFKKVQKVGFWPSYQLGMQTKNWKWKSWANTYMQIFFQIENVRMLDRYNSKQPLSGTLYLTATHLIFVGPDSKKETWVSNLRFL